MSFTISDQDLQKWAEYLVFYSLGGITKDDLVMIKGEPITWPLMNKLQEIIWKEGGRVDINLVAPDNDRGKVWGAAAAKFSTPEQIARVPEWMVQRYEQMTKYIEILGAEHPDYFANLPEETSQAIMKADEPLKNIRLAKPWVLTLYPTQAFAEMEGMTLEEYAKIVVGASTIDPRYLEEVEEEIYQVMDQAKAITIITEHPHEKRELKLTMNIENKNIIKCTGKRNFPDGEVFTSPDARTPEGEIFVDLPVFYGGTTIQGIYLKFKGGKIVDYKADQAHETLQKIIETDEGSHRLGEVALGMNAGIQVALKHPLFVEKVGGTLHIAIGASYPECFVEDPSDESMIGKLFQEGILNKSAQHVDIVTDFRPGGTGRKVFLDDTELIVKDNIWKVKK
jgi:aminopeptidase